MAIVNELPQYIEEDKELKAQLRAFLDDAFPDGTVLKKGTKVVYAIYAMGRMEAIWGKDCQEFKPERWLRDGRYMSESAYKFTAFNGGPRLCLGKDFAYYQMKFAAASILYRYRVKVVENHLAVPKLALTMYMKHGLKILTPSVGTISWRRLCHDKLSKALDLYVDSAALIYSLELCVRLWESSQKGSWNCVVCSVKDRIYRLILNLQESGNRHFTRS
ncbi:hypothetical protein LguiB_020459 [Lonicera macranthoides]